MLKRLILAMSIVAVPAIVRADCTAHEEKQAAADAKPAGEAKSGCKMMTASADMKKCSMEAEKGCCKSKSGEASAEMCSKMANDTNEKLAEALQKGNETELTGKVVCAACDLKSAEQCQHVLKSGDALYVIVMDAESMKLFKATGHGDKDVKIKGKVAVQDGKSYVQVLSFEELAAKAA